MRLRGMCAPLEALCDLDSLCDMDSSAVNSSAAGSAALDSGAMDSTVALDNVAGADALNPRAEQLVDSVCRQIVAALQELGLTRSDETFLDWHRPYVDEKMRDYTKMKERD